MDNKDASRGPSALDKAAIAAFSNRFTQAPTPEIARAMGDIDAAMDTWLPPEAMANVFRTLNTLSKHK